MNLIEVVMAASIVLGACSGAAQLGTSSAQAMSHSRLQAQRLEQIEAQWLAVAPVLDAAEGELDPADCPAAAQWMQQQLQAGLPPLAAGLQRELRLSDNGDAVLLVLSGEGLRTRERHYSPAAFGLCTGVSPAHLEADDAQP